MAEAAPLRDVGTEFALELNGLSKSFGALIALSDISFKVRPGERHAVLGSNGAGKTTLFNCITGDFPPSTGSVKFFGEDITFFQPHERIRRCRFISERAFRSYTDTYPNAATYRLHYNRA